MVDPLIISAGIGAASNLIGGLFGNKSQEDTNKRNVEQQVLDRAYQKEFAQSGIQWRVKDAQAAGIHPLYSLGASIPTFSPVSENQVAPQALSKGVQRAGQDISRAVAATSSETQRYTSARLAELSIQRGQLENDLLRLQIRRQTSQVGPGFPAPSASANLAIPGQGDARISDSRMDRTVPHAAVTSQEPGAVTDRGHVWTGSGYAPVPSLDAKERIEDQILPEMAWAWRNMVKPNLPHPTATPPPKNWLPKGASHWKWSFSGQEWRANNQMINPRRRPNMRRPGGRSFRQSPRKRGR